MNKMIRRFLLVALLLTAFGSTTVMADTSPVPPLCPPGGCGSGNQG